MPSSGWRLASDRTLTQAARIESAGWSQRFRRFLRDVVVDRLGGRFGLRVLRLGERRILVIAETVDCLADAVARRHLISPASRHFTVVVAWWSGPWRGWTGRPGPLSGVVRQRLRFPAGGRGPVTVDLLLDRPVGIDEALGAALIAVRPVADSCPIGVVDGTAPVAAEPSTGFVPAHPGTRPAPATAMPIDRTAVLVDVRRINPRGRRVESYRADAPRFRLDLGGGVDARPESWRNRGPWGWPGQPAWRRGEFNELGWRTVAALRSVGLIEVAFDARVPTQPGKESTWDSQRAVRTGDPFDVATVLVALAMTGVVLSAPGLDGAVAELLAPELRAILTEPLTGPATGPLEQETRSVRQRRAALRGHSVQFGPDVDSPTVTALLATRRAEHLPGILRAIAGQTYPYLEILLCLHGIGLPDECRDYLDHCGRSVEVVAVPGEVSFGIALGLATRLAGGRLITKFDDDDTYGPEHVWDLVLARSYSGATLVGKGIEFVHLEGANMTVRRRSGRPESDTDVVAGGTMLIARDDLEALGGWRPVPRSVDRGLLDRVNRAGGTVYRTHPLGYLYHRRSVGHTWAADDDFFLRHARQRWPGIPRLAEFGTAARTAAPHTTG
jgi:hypothetical protein